MKKQPDFSDLYSRPDVAGRTEILTPEPETAQQSWFAKWEATRPQGQWGRWHISDRDWAADPL